MIDISTLEGIILLGASFDVVKGEPNSIVYYRKW